MRTASIPIALAIATAAAAQQETAGRVVGKDGKPWVDAEVALRSRPAFPIRELGLPDRISVRTDKFGRFRAGLRGDRTYAVVARTSTGVQTDVRHGVVSGDRILLRESNAQPEPLEVKRIGIEAWSQADEIRVFVESQGSLVGQLRWLDELSGSSCFFRPAPYGLHRLRLRTRAFGLRPVWGVLRIDGESHGIARVRVPPPRKVRLSVRDGKTGAAIADARIWLPYNELGENLGVETDDHGAALLWIPAWDGRSGQSVMRRYPLLVRRHGYRIAGTFWRSGDQASDRLTLDLMPGRALRGRVLHHGKPVPGVPVLLSLEVRNRGMSRTRGEFVLRTGRDGGFETCAQFANADFPRAALLAGPVLDRLKPKRDRQVPEVPTVLLPVKQLKGGGRGIEIPALEQLRILELRFLNPDRSPASAVRVRLIPRQRRADTWETGIDRMFRSNRAGRCRIASFRDTVNLMAIAPSGYFAGSLPEASSAVVLEPFAYCSGQVVDPAGKPRGSMAIRWIRTTGGVSEIDVASGRWITRYNRGLCRAASDSSGRFSLRFIPLEGITYWVGTWHGNCVGLTGSRDKLRFVVPE